MSVQGLLHIKKAVSSLNPEQVRIAASRPLQIAIRAGSTEGYRRIENFLLQDLSAGRRSESAAYLNYETNPGQGLHDLTIYDEGVIAPPRSLIYRAGRPEDVVRSALEKHPDLGVSLARSFLPFGVLLSER